MKRLAIIVLLLATLPALAADDLATNNWHAYQIRMYEVGAVSGSHVYVWGITNGQAASKCSGEEHAVHRAGGPG